MRITFWGTRGSLAVPGPATSRYGGNTSCVQVEGAEGTVLVLDAGTGIRALGLGLPRGLRRVDVLLSHLHMDHIQGLGFFAPLFDPVSEVHIWGPASSTLSLRDRLMRYLSAPLFPVRLRDLPCKLTLHEVPCGPFEIDEFELSSTLVCHPGPTVGYRIAGADGVIAYLSDHEPALGGLGLSPEWTSGYGVAEEADVLIHDAQYTDEEYDSRIGWGHSSLAQALQFASVAKVKHLVPFHHDPTHGDEALDAMLAAAVTEARPDFKVTAAQEGAVFEVP